MAGLFASMAVKWALDKLSSFLRASLTSPPTASSSSSLAVQDDLEDLRSLERTMRRIRATLQDAEEHWNIREESAKLRLEELKEVAYDAEDVVDEYEYEVNRCKLEALERSAGVQSSNKKRKRHEGNGTDAIDAGTVAILNELVVRARQIMKRYDEIIKDHGNLALTENDGERLFAPDIRSLREVGSYVCERSIFGREHDKDNIVEKLLPREDERIENPISVQAIVGMGGLGKTTLAQLVYNDPRVCQSFDMLAWVCVSDQFDVCNITRKIIISLLGDKKCEVTDLANLQDKLLSKIKGKKILLVLDDVWNERGDCWERLCAPLSETRVCKIIVTTRSEVVARLVQTMPFYRINVLSSDESWSMFKQVVFTVHQENDTPANLVEIGRSIVKKCNGLPLAIKTLASMLRYENDEMRWRYVLESQLWNLEQSQNEVLPALELSYKPMPIYLKRCFVSLSLFPKDHSLSEKKVLQLWETLDLLQCDGSNEEAEIGRLYLSELVQRSFLQVYFGEHTMHDLVHDLACFLAGEEFFRLKGHTPIEIPRNARYMSVLAASAKISVASGSLRAIVVLAEWDVKIENLEALFLDCKKLRALSLGNLEALRSGIGHLINLKLLRHLKYGVGRFYMPWPAQSGIGHLPARSGIGHLINLRTLPPIYISRCECDRNCNIRELRNLNEIRKLRIQGWGSVCLIEDANEAQLLSKKHLQSLKLYFSGQHNYCNYCKQSVQTEPVTVTQEQLLVSLRPHDGLRKLTIQNYESEKYPNWLGNASFYNLTKVVLRGSNSQHVPTLGELPSLKSLRIQDMHCVRQIGREFCSHAPGMKGFRSLTRLEFHDLLKWSKWSGVDDGDFPCLHTLFISYAGRLRSLPSAPFPSLVKLVLSDCGKLATVPALPTLRDLCIKWCAALNELPTLPSLLNLELRQCPNLRAVGSLPSLTTMVLNSCGNLATVPACPTLRDLCIKWCAGLNKLPTLPSLLNLELRQCPNLRAVGSLPSLITMVLNLCGNLATVPACPTLRDLCIEWCAGLNELPTLPSLLSLELTYCPNLRAVGSLPSLITMVLNSCENLATVPACPTLRELCIKRCAALNELPTLPSLSKLELRYCRNLRAVGSLPSLLNLELRYCPNLSAIGSLPSLTRSIAET